MGEPLQCPITTKLTELLYGKVGFSPQTDAGGRSVKPWGTAAENATVHPPPPPAAAPGSSDFARPSALLPPFVFLNHATACRSAQSKRAPSPAANGGGPRGFLKPSLSPNHGPSAFSPASPPPPHPGPQAALLTPTGSNEYER